jgi:hypothetical protein
MKSSIVKHPQNSLAPVDKPAVVIPEQPVPGNVCDAVDRLIRALNGSFGCDHAFTISARGQIIAASTARHAVGPRDVMIEETAYYRS